jgi:hypothetical protein
MKLSRCHCLVLLLVLCWVTPPLSAQGTAEKPTPKVGDKWEFQQTVKAVPAGESSQPYSRQVVEVQPEGFKMVGGNNQSLQFDAALNFVDPKGAEYSFTTFKFPMSVGSEWKYTARTGATGQLERNGTYKVAAFESVTVPAGTFECFRVDGEWQVNGRGYTGRGAEKIWYCPKINFIAKRSSDFSATTRDSGASSEVRLVELTKFTPGP